MSNRLLDEISGKLRGLIANSPVEDLEKNVRTLLASTFARLDLVTREEFDVQREVLKRAREKIARLEARLTDVERNTEK
jgi:BMFP domain-containing protein YqiC